ncbi:uncharacterized protein LOC110188456 [Drosophila serrata]|uniref:uncharacterized protein LOC110188456 n=1 Tax=Drosophila serrata TaxID=7274 RepID=UPI000A1D2392|nr:uncharacterized protein LOC110188456 [Drosophila serrata]
MEVQVGWPKLLKMGAKMVGHKFQQYRLATGHTVVLDTNYGQVRGLQRKTLYDEELYFAFEGIPYAKPPVGELRFKAPQLPEPWQGVLNCTTYRSKPLQRNMILGIVEGSEDCLHLNVYAKTLKSEKPLPVIVWIYGGGFQKGEASRDIYSPDYFMKQSVVFVTINYRLGALGFLSLRDPKLDVPGNAGLKDQVMALRWISQNIAHFNGDANNITLMGESAGAASVHVMMTTEQTRGLFHKAILQSGCALSEWAESPDRQWAFRLAKKLGYKGDEKDADVLGFLSRVSPQKIATCDQDIITQDEVRSFLLFAFGPVVEPYESEHCVVPRRHKELLAGAWGNDIPIIMGGNSFEGLFSYQILRGDPWVMKNFHNILPREVSEASSQEERDLLVRRLKEVYFNNGDQQTMDMFEALNIFSHRQIWHDMHRLALARRTYAPSKSTYLYRFDFDSPHFNQFRWLVCGNRVRGVSHGDDLSYLFYNVISSKLEKSSKEYQTIERMVGMWTSFAAKGDPNCEEIGDAKWEPLQPMESGVEQCFNISHDLEMLELPEADSLALWDTFYPKEALFYMEVNVEWPKLLKMGAKMVGHKFQQYRLATGEKVVLDTKYGLVQGLQRKTLYDEELYFAFEGIPYAKPPVGELRFKAPQPPEPWQGVLNCTTYRSKPLQRNMVLGIVEGSEDCLHLNVYAKTLKSEKPLPVIVWIYGGGFQKGEASRDIYSPDYFMKQSVVFVTINYRLGALGFLSLKDSSLDVPGNAGLKDQVLALRWISQNIAHFNGDPNNITLMGESAGAASVHVMMTTEQTRGLFHKAILQSGCALNEWAECPDRNWAFRLAQSLGYKGGEKEADVLCFLRSASARKMASADQDLVTLEEMRSFLLFSFAPVVEPYETDHCVVPRRQKDLLSEAWGNQIPVIMGGNSFEGLFSYQVAKSDPWCLNNFQYILPREIKETANHKELDILVRRLKKHYFNNELHESMDLFEALNIFSHRQIWHDMHRLALARRTYASHTPTYLYRFDFDSPHFNQFRWLVCGDSVRGVSHADELSYLFYNIIASKLDKSSKEYQTIERMVGMWTSFAATGNPNCREMGNAKWEPLQPMESGVEQCFNISKELDMRELPEAKALAVWDSFYSKEDLY